MRHTTDGNTLQLAGSLDVRCTAELRDVVYRLLAEHEHEVLVVDISEVESVDLTALKLLAVASRTAERRGRRLVLRGGSPGVRRLLHLSHLRWMLPVESDDPATRPHPHGTLPEQR
jgi:anti-anti-sigma factor